MRRVGRYEIVSEIASGGMATVHLARSLGADGFSRQCAVKLLHPHLARERGFAELFLDEARIASRIHHPNVCQIHDFGRAEDGTAFIAMEHLDGKTFSQVLAALVDRDGTVFSRPTLAMLAWILAEAADGLAAAHESRDDAGRPLEIVHRDVSPQNLFVTFDGAVKVLDFGIARARDQIHETMPGEIKGKYGYMAPEQMRGEPLDARADVWALGVVLWEMLARARLFRRETHAATVDAVQRDAIAAPSDLVPDVPRELEAIAMRALSRARSERIGSARRMAEDLRAAARALSDAKGRSDVAEWMRALFRTPGGASVAETTAATVASPRVIEPPTAATDASASAAGMISATPAAPRARWLAAGVLATVVLVGLAWASSRGLAPEPAPVTHATDPATEPAVRPPADEPPLESAPARDAVTVEPARQGEPADPPPVVTTTPRARRGSATAEGTSAPAHDDTEGAEPPPSPAARPEGHASPGALAVGDTHTVEATPPPQAATHGCVVVELGRSVRIDDGRVLYGPLQCARVAPGPHRIRVVDADGANLGEPLAFTVEPGMTYRAGVLLGPSG